MGSSAPPPADTTHDGFFRLVIVALILAAVYQLIHFIQAKILWLFHAHYWETVLTFCAITSVALLIGSSLLWNWWIKRRELEAVTQEDEESVYLGQEIK